MAMVNWWAGGDARSVGIYFYSCVLNTSHVRIVAYVYNMNYVYSMCQTHSHVHTCHFNICAYF